MPLWNEIEAQTLDGLKLGKLLRSEGRTAWFSTTDPKAEIVQDDTISSCHLYAFQIDNPLHVTSTILHMNSGRLRFSWNMNGSRMST